MADEQLEWLLQLESKLDGAKRFVSELGRVEGALERASGSISGTERRIGRFDRVLSAAGRAGRDFLAHFTAQAAWDTLKAGVGTMVDLGAAAMQAADEERKLAASFDTLIGIDNRQVAWEWLERLAMVLPGTDDDLKALSRTLLTVGVPLQSLEAFLIGANDAAVLTGRSVEDVTGALSEIVRRGEFDARKLSAFGLKEAEVLDVLGKATGKTHEQVKKLMQDGQIAGVDVGRAILQALATRSGGELGGASLVAGDTALEKIKDLKDAGEDLLKDLLIELDPAIGSVVSSLTEQLGPDGMLGGEVKSLLSGIAEGAKSVDWVSGVSAMVSMLKFAVETTQTLVSAAGTAFGAIKKVTDVLGITDDTEATNAALRTDVDVIASQMALGDMANRRSVLTEMGLGRGKSSAQLLAELKDKFARAGGTQAEVDAFSLSGDWSRFGALTGGIASAESTAKEAGARIGKAVVDGAKGPQGVDAHSPSRKFQEIGQMSAEGYARGFSSSVPAIQQSMAPMIPARSRYADHDLAFVGERSVSLNAPITLNVQVSGSRGNAQEIAEEIRAILPGALQNALEQMSIEAGVT